MWMNLSLKSYYQIKPHTYYYIFNLSSKSEIQINQTKPYNPLHFVKLGIFDNEKNLIDERHYSLLNNPFISEKDYFQFKFLIKDNYKLSDMSYSFSYKLRKIYESNKNDYQLDISRGNIHDLYKNFSFMISYPYGDISFDSHLGFSIEKSQGDTTYISNNIIKNYFPKNLFLISVGTGVVPMIQLLNYIKIKFQSSSQSPFNIKLFHSENETSLDDNDDSHLNSKYNEFIIKEIMENIVFDNQKFYLSYDNDYHNDVSNLKKKLSQELPLRRMNEDDDLFIICGSKVMKEEVINVLLKKGYLYERIFCF